METVTFKVSRNRRKNTEWEPLGNPFYQLRTDAGWSLSDLARRSHIDIKALRRAEYAMYILPLPSLVEFWMRHNHLHQESANSIEHQYLNYVAIRRDLFKRGFLSGLIPPVESNEHPLRILRHYNSLGLTEFCKLLCVPLDTVQFFERKWRLQQSVPKALCTAFYDMGYTLGEVDEFELRYKTWRDSQNNYQIEVQ